MSDAMIEVVDLTKRYGEVQALRGLSFSVPRGQVVGLLGPNGAGKTTTMRVLTGFVAPTEGAARVDGLDVVEDAPECRRKIGYLPEGNPLYRDLRVEELLQFAARLHKIPREDREREVSRSLEIAGLKGSERRIVETLSKGMRQRVGLAQALLHEPSILILDEPTSGLDPNQQEDMRTLIRTLGADRTVILSTHILPEVEAVCDRALIIDRGELVADDSVEGIKHQQASEVILRATVRGAAETVETALGFASEGLELLPVEGGVFDVRLALGGADERETLERVAAALVGAGLGLSRLVAETASLESVFAALTREGARPGHVAPTSEDAIPSEPSGADVEPDAETGEEG